VFPWSPHHRIYGTTDARATALQIDDSSGAAGLLPMLNNLMTIGTFVDAALSSRIQIHIVRVITSCVVAAGRSKNTVVSESSFGSTDKNLFQLMCKAGVVRVAVRYTTACMSAMHDVPKANRALAYSKEYRSVTGSYLGLLCSLLHINNSHVQQQHLSVVEGERNAAFADSIEVIEELMDLNFIQLLVEDWLQDPTFVDFTLGEVDQSPLLVRSEAILLMHALLLHKPASTQLITEMSR